MRVLFMGSPAFALPTLTRLAARGDLVGVVTQPDRPSGRGHKLHMSAVKEAALARGLPVLQPVRLRDPAAVAQIRALTPDVIVVVAYGQILPAQMLTLPRLGCLNVHASLLPHYRGASPVQAALLGNENVTGVTIMRMDEGLDTGPILLQREIAIAEDDTAGTLGARLAELGGGLLMEVLDRLETGALSATPQDAQLASYAPKLSKQDARVNFGEPAQRVCAVMRAMDPEPGPWIHFRGQPLQIFGARRVAGVGAAGTVLACGPNGLVVACADGAVAIAQVLPAGKRRMSADTFARGYRIAPGDSLGS